MHSNELLMQMMCPVKAQNAGLFISRGDAMHPTRIIDSHELIFVIQGELDMWEADQEFHLEADQTLLLWPGREHGSTKLMPASLKFYWLHFEVEVGEDNLNQNFTTGSSNLSTPTSIPQIARLPQPEGIERLFRIFLNEQETGALRPLSANLLTMLILIEVAKQARGRVDTNGLNVAATWAHSYIRMNFDRPITASTVAEHVGYNVDYLGRVYRQTYDCTLTEAIHRRRINKACDYLLNSNLGISQLAFKCGFRDADYFRRIFKRYRQITPGQYRDENSRLHVITDSSHYPGSG